MAAVLPFHLPSSLFRHSRAGGCVGRRPPPEPEDVRAPRALADFKPRKGKKPARADEVELPGELTESHK